MTIPSDNVTATITDESGPAATNAVAAADLPLHTKPMVAAADFSHNLTKMLRKANAYCHH